MSTESTLLVVDDEDAICEGCRRIFSRQGFQVKKCSNATEGLNLATSGDYTAILLDIKMPEMDGLHFLEALRKEKPNVPVVLMTGYPSIPNAAAAIRLGASDYVTKPFTPEEISQAVHRLLHDGEGNGDKRTKADDRSLESTASNEPFCFYHNAWHQSAAGGAARVGAMIVKPGVSAISLVRLPRIGEVVYRGLPLALATDAQQSEQIIAAPLSGVVVSVNDALEGDPSALLSDPCGAGWIACISPTRLDEEIEQSMARRVVLLSRNAAAGEQAGKLRRLGCEVLSIASPEELNTAVKDNQHLVLLFDGMSFGEDGPNVIGAINAEHSSLKIVVFGAKDGSLEPAYRVRHIFYYAVEPFADNEIAAVLDAAFPTRVVSPSNPRREPFSVLGSISITNRNRTNVRLLAAPGLLHHEYGIGYMLRSRLMQQRFPVESSPSLTDITPMNILSAAARCDRLFVLLAQDVGRLPGSLVRDTKAEYIALVGAGADRVTTLLVQPGDVKDDLLALDPAVAEALADQLAREMASC